MIEALTALPTGLLILIVWLVLSMILVAYAAFAFGNPSRTNLARRPVPLPDHRPDWVGARVHPRPVSLPRDYTGQHRSVGERTINLRDYRDRLGP